MEVAKLTTDLTRSDKDIIQDSHTSPNYYVTIFFFFRYILHYPLILKVSFHYSRVILTTLPGSMKVPKTGAT
jgi:hypothetical protein